MLSNSCWKVYYTEQQKNNLNISFTTITHHFNIQHLNNYPITNYTVQGLILYVRHQNMHTPNVRKMNKNYSTLNKKEKKKNEIWIYIGSSINKNYICRLNSHDDENFKKKKKKNYNTKEDMSLNSHVSHLEWLKKLNWIEVYFYMKIYMCDEKTKNFRFDEPKNVPINRSNLFWAYASSW